MRKQSEIPLEWVLIDTPEALTQAITSLATGTGPIGIDTERASNIRYDSGRVYLLQISRRDTGNYLIDPIALPDLTELAEFLADIPWILHACRADLPGLRDLGLEPSQVFDTEYAARILGIQGVGLAALTERYLGIELAKEYTRSDWGERPLPTEWLEYAAFDSAVLPDLWEKIAADLLSCGRYEIALQEFDILRLTPVKPAPEKPWHALKGFGTLRESKERLIARELWLARDKQGQKHDVSPNLYIPDRSIVFAAKYNPRSPQDLAKQRDFNGRAAHSMMPVWWRAIKRAKVSSEFEPALKYEKSEIPGHHTWRKNNPLAHDALQALRECVAEIAETEEFGTEQLISSDAIRHLAWYASLENNTKTVSELLADAGAREWQINILAQKFSETLTKLESDTEIA